MDKPKCKLCGQRHGLNEPHKWMTAEAAWENRLVPQPTVVINTAPEKSASSVPAEEGPSSASCPVCEARRQRAKEYMRAYRKERG